MRDGALWSAQADFLFRMIDWDSPARDTMRLVDAERISLLRLDVPHFESLASELSPMFGPASKHDDRDMSGLARSRRRIVEFDEREVAWQEEVLLTLTTASASSGAAQVSDAHDAASHASTTNEEDETYLLAEAESIGAFLTAHAFREGDALCWLGLDWLDDTHALQLVPLDFDLYNGTSGLGVFFVALYASTGRAEHRDTAAACFTAVRHQLKGSAKLRMARQIGMGAATVLGSIIYALTVAGTLLNDDEMIADAARFSSLMTDEIGRVKPRFWLERTRVPTLCCAHRRNREDTPAHGAHSD